MDQKEKSRKSKNELETTKKKSMNRLNFNEDPPHKGKGFQEQTRRESSGGDLPDIDQKETSTHAKEEPRKRAHEGSVKKEKRHDVPDIDQKEKSTKPKSALETPAKASANMFEKMLERGHPILFRKEPDENVQESAAKKLKVHEYPFHPANMKFSAETVDLTRKYSESEMANWVTGVGKVVYVSVCKCDGGVCDSSCVCILKSKKCQYGCFCDWKRCPNYEKSSPEELLHYEMLKPKPQVVTVENVPAHDWPLVLQMFNTFGIPVIKEEFDGKIGYVVVERPMMAIRAIGYLDCREIRAGIKLRVGKKGVPYKERPGYDPDSFLNPDAFLK